MFLVTLKMSKMGVFGLSDYFVCHARAFFLILPHFISYAQRVSDKKRHRQEYSMKSFDRLILQISNKISEISLQIDSIKKEIQRNQASQQKEQQSWLVQSSLQKEAIVYDFQQNIKKMNQNVFRKISTVKVYDQEKIQKYIYEYVQDISKAKEKKQ